MLDCAPDHSGQRCLALRLLCFLLRPWPLKTASPVLGVVSTLFKKKIWKGNNHKDMTPVATVCPTIDAKGNRRTPHFCCNLWLDSLYKVLHIFWRVLSCGNGGGDVFIKIPYQMMEVCRIPRTKLSSKELTINLTEPNFFEIQIFFANNLKRLNYFKPMDFFCYFCASSNHFYSSLVFMVLVCHSSGSQLYLGSNKIHAGVWGRRVAWYLSNTTL